MPYMPEQKPRTSLPFILHQADLMAARIEFEREWLPRLKENKKPVDAGKGNYTLGNKPNMSPLDPNPKYLGFSILAR